MASPSSSSSSGAPQTLDPYRHEYMSTVKIEPVLILPVDVVFDVVDDLGGGFGNMPNEGRGDVIGRRYVLGVVRNEGDVRGRNLLLLGLGGLMRNKSMIILDGPEQQKK